MKFYATAASLNDNSNNNFSLIFIKFCCLSMGKCLSNSSQKYSNSNYSLLMKRSEEWICGLENREHRLSKMRFKWLGHVKCRDENSILRTAMKLEGWRPLGRPKKTLGKVVEDMTEDKKWWRQLISCPTPGERSNNLILQ